jgi:hypothetical protein
VNKIQIAFIHTVFVICTVFASPTTADTGLMDVLDEDQNGVLDPYEALDSLLMAQQEVGELNEETLLAWKARQNAEVDREIHEVVASLDENRNGMLEPRELGEEGSELVGELDLDRNGVLDLEEASAMDDEDQLLLTPDEVSEQVADYFQESDKDQDGHIDIATEVADEDRSRAAELDGNRDGRVSRSEALTFISADNIPVKFEVEDKVAYMSGVITSRLPAKVLRLLFEHPEVEVIEMQIVPGSIDDVANLRAATYIHRHGLTTRLTSTSSVASGGTDFFVGGKHRIIEKGATVGVHSWSPGGGLDGSDIPRDDPQHQMYIDFYENVGIPGDFYWFTMDAAPPERIHLMTEEEILRFGLRTADRAD